MSEYNIPVLVKWFEKRPSHWNDKMCAYMGTVIMCREYGDELVRGPEQVNYGGWAWRHEYVIPNPTPSQIAEEARKAGKEPVTTEPKWRRMGPNEIITAEDRIHHSSDNLEQAHKTSGSIGLTVEASTCAAAWTLRPTPEAAQSAQKGKMEPKQVKPPKPTICEVALRAARERVDGLAKLKDTQDRIKSAKASLAKDSKDRRAAIVALEAEAATLSKKWLKGVGK